MYKAKLVVYPDGNGEIYFGGRFFCTGKLGQSARLEAMIDSFFVDRYHKNVVKLQRKEGK